MTLRDVRRCENCSVVGPLTQQGRCSTCGSEAVDRPEKIKAKRNMTVQELEEMLKEGK